MKEALDCILLVDDDPADNLFHRRVLEKAALARRIEVVGSGPEALDYLRGCIPGNAGGPVRPELIFLDVNMPGMTGWEFLEKYALLPSSQRAKAVIVMLSTPLFGPAREQADRAPAIAGFCKKPLSRDRLREILDRHF